MSAIDDIITLYNSGHSATAMNLTDMQRVIDARSELTQLRAADIRTMKQCGECGSVMVFRADTLEDAEPFCAFCELVKARATIAEQALRLEYPQ